MFRQVHPGTSDRNSMPSTTDLAPGGDRDLTSSLAQAHKVQTTDQAVPVAEVSGSSIRANTSNSGMKVVQALKRQKLDTPPVSTPSVLEVFSPPLVSPRRNAVVFSSTAFDDHSTNSSGFLENSPCLALADGIPNAPLAENVHPTIAAPSLRITGNSHEADCTGRSPVPRTPAGCHTAAHLDASNITSPEDTLSGQSRHASRGSHVPSTEVQPSSSNAPVPKEPKARKTVNSIRKSRKTSSNGSRNKEVKDKPKLITPLEYAQKLQSCLDLRVKTNYLKGKRIFYIGGDMMYASTTTRGRMEYVSHFYLLFSHCRLRVCERLWLGVNSYQIAEVGNSDGLTILSADCEARRDIGSKI